MQVTGSHLSKSPDSNIRAHNPDLFLRKEAYQQAQDGEAARGTVIAGESTEIAPSPYMIVISRIDGMLRKGGVDNRVIDQLQQLLTARIRGLTLAARRALLELPPAQELAIDSAVQLPQIVAGGLRDANRREAVMNLLRDPDFAAAMKDESRTATYGPRGLLRAS